MNSIEADDLDARGFAAVEEALQRHPRAVITVRGKQRFVVMYTEEFKHLRECEMLSALEQTRADIAAGRFTVESPDEHLARLERALSSPTGSSETQ